MSGVARQPFARVPVASFSTTRAGATRPGRPMRTRGIDAETVVWRLEEAGAALLALPETGPSTRLRTSVLEIVRDPGDEQDVSGRIRPPVPDGARVDRMDEALAWVAFIPGDRPVLRRIVQARSLVHPLTGKHLFPWRRLGVAVGADHKAVQRWHGQAIDFIVRALRV